MCSYRLKHLFDNIFNVKRLIHPLIFRFQFFTTLRVLLLQIICEKVTCFHSKTDLGNQLSMWLNEVGILFVPDADFAIKTDSPRVESGACIFNDIFRIDSFPSTMPFNDFRAVRIQSLRERVDHVFICVLGRD